MRYVIIETLPCAVTASDKPRLLRYITMLRRTSAQAVCGSCMFHPSENLRLGLEIHQCGP